VSQQAATTAPVAPDSNAGISPTALQQVIDQAATFNIFSMPKLSGANESIPAPGDLNTTIGMKVQEELHRFRITVDAPTASKPLTARNRIGENAGQFTHRWMICPEDWGASPNREPPPTPLDPSRSQRFVMLDSICSFGSGGDGFRGFGTGRTIPATIDGQQQILITAVGAILEGFGRFRGHDEGTYVYCGALTPQRAFIGNIVLRVMDPQQTLTSDSDLSEIETRPNPEPYITYIVFRGQAIPSDSVSPRIGPNGQPNGLTVVQGLRLIDLDFKGGGRGVRSVTRVGPPLGSITASVTFDPSAPGGGNLNPIPFLADDQFTFFSDEGDPSVGAFHANSTEGRVFKTLLAGQPGIRFGGTGLILDGAGPFAGIRGLMTDNSVVAFTPHVSASVYMLRIHDPQGRFRSSDA